MHLTIVQKSSRSNNLRVGPFEYFRESYNRKFFLGTWYFWFFFRVTCFEREWYRVYDLFLVQISLKRTFLKNDPHTPHPSKVKWFTPSIRFNSNKSQTLPGHLITDGNWTPTYIQFSCAINISTCPWRYCCFDYRTLIEISKFLSIKTSVNLFWFLTSHWRCCAIYQTKKILNNYKKYFSLTLNFR